MSEYGQEILRFEKLSIGFATGRGLVQAARGISFAIRKSESFALIGESGSGKSTIAFAALNYLPSNARILAGRVLLNGEDPHGAPVDLGQADLDRLSGPSYLP
jgi:peptide/nickel transport system ATP-binding protein